LPLSLSHGAVDLSKLVFRGGGYGRAFGVAKAEVPLTGFFIAREACPALQSIRNATNPGEVKTEPGKSYPIIAKNKPNASHYFFEVEGADPTRRWLAVAASTSSPPMGQASRRRPGPGRTGQRPNARRIRPFGQLAAGLLRNEAR
jgi:hypothetical protein